MLDSPFSKDEIKKTTFNLRKLKALGPNGVQAGFFHIGRFWVMMVLRLSLSFSIKVNPLPQVITHLLPLSLK